MKLLLRSSKVSNTLYFCLCDNEEVKITGYVSYNFVWTTIFCYNPVIRLNETFFDDEGVIEKCVKLN